jgi:hypothetical protein
VSPLTGSDAPLEAMSSAADVIYADRVTVHRHDLRAYMYAIMYAF